MSLRETAGVGPRRNAVLIISMLLFISRRSTDDAAGPKTRASDTRATSSRAHSPAVRDRTHPHQSAGRDDVRTSFRTLPGAPTFRDG